MVKPTGTAVVPEDWLFEPPVPPPPPLLSLPSFPLLPLVLVVPVETVAYEPGLERNDD